MFDAKEFLVAMRRMTEKLDEVVDRLDRIVELLEEAGEPRVVVTTPDSEWTSYTHDFELD